ncbi:MAG: methyltransferase domain-containing protein [bacterium]
MQLIGPATQDIAEEVDVMARLLPLKHAQVLELGCGTAEKTRELAEKTPVARIVAAEVDPIAHARNLALGALPKIEFATFGAEAIDAADNTFDIVLMFKSLHHVPLDLMDQALGEIRRVLKPGGLAYISEPVFAGDFNEVLRLFHDESRVRQAAFDAIRRAVAGAELALEQEYFFKNRITLKHFGQFENGVMAATHTEHILTPALMAQVKARFESYGDPENGYTFLTENRVDLLRKSAA